MAPTAEPTTAHRSLYYRCPTCGRYITADERQVGRYCSAECAQTYLRCLTCGRYYPETDAYTQEHCSPACATQYSLRRTYGPAAIDIRMEELV